ncbi:MAG: Uma2 family endonuclease [Bacteroidota bacterium]
MSMDDAVRIIRDDYTVEEYYDLFDEFERKIEYHDGRIEMMAGASGAHNDLTANLTAQLISNTKKCKFRNSDQAVKIPSFNRYVYPDLSFVCEKMKFEDTQRRMLLNPSLIVEVLSESTANKDRSEKFNWYFSLPSVKEYLLVDSQKMDVKSYFRKQDGNWAIQSYWLPEQVLNVRTLGEEISLQEIYEDVVLAPTEE